MGKKQSTISPFLNFALPAGNKVQILEFTKDLILKDSCPSKISTSNFPSLVVLRLLLTNLVNIFFFINLFFKFILYKMNLIKFINSHYKTQESKGDLTSIISIVIGNILNIIFNKYYGMEIHKSTLLSVYMIANIIAYILDILFAKEKLFVKMYKGQKNYYGKIPYNDYKVRLHFLLKSFMDKYFLKFIVLTVIDSIIGLTILRFLIKLCDMYDILTKWKYRDLTLAFLVSSVTFFLFVSKLRFDWSYEYKENFMLNVLMYIWLSIILLIAVSVQHLIIVN